MLPAVQVPDTPPLIVAEGVALPQVNPAGSVQVVSPTSGVLPQISTIIPFMLFALGVKVIL
jgi:hypothetical protein